MSHHESTEAALPDLLANFYGRARQDALIGPLFNEAVQDWPDHLARIGDFWSSILLATGRYKGNPVAKHLPHAARLTPAMFARWLEIWKQTTDEILPPELATAMQAKAGRIAESLQLAIAFPSPAQKAMIDRGHSPPSAV